MPFAVPRDRPGWRTSLTRRIWLVALTVLAVAAAGATASLQRVGDRAVRAEVIVHQLDTELHIQRSLEVEAVTGDTALEDLEPEMAASFGRALSLASEAARGELTDAEGAALVSRTHAYQNAVRAALALVREGDMRGARDFDNSVVDGVFTAYDSLLGVTVDRVEQRADQQRRLNYAGLATTAALLIAITLVVQWRVIMTRMRRDEEAKVSARYRALVDGTSDLVMIADSDGALTFLSPAAQRFVTDRVGEIEGGPTISAILHPEDLPAMLRALAPRPGATGDATLLARAGSGPGWRRLELTVRDLRDDPSVRGLVVTGHDVTDREDLHAELMRTATHDELTGLANRAAISAQLLDVLLDAHGTKDVTGLLLIDLDRFKEINDTLGHPVGDQLLTEVGPRLEAAVRPGDTVARLGGDEFAVLLPQVGSADEAVSMAGQILDALKAPFPVAGMDLPVEASIGVVVSPKDGKDATALLRRADVAMYRAKRLRQGVVAYDRSIDHHRPELLSLLADLRKGIDAGELVVHFQPQVALSTMQLHGAEALVRWEHPVKGLLPPDSFVPLAERTGLITPLTARVLDLALAQARRWMDAGAATTVSVNLSAENLRDDELDALVAAQLAAHGVPAELLTLEVTESAIMVDAAAAAGMLHRLATLGVRISLDDFGAGYTSLGQLTSLPLRELKIDKAFVQTMDTDRGNALIVRSVVDLGHNLGLATVAEGVESVLSMDSLGGYGCDIAQGYRLSRPLPPAAFDAWRARFETDGITGDEAGADLPRQASPSDAAVGPATH